MNESDWANLESRPVLQCVRLYGIDLRPGDRVRLWPNRKADILDLALDGKIATIESIEEDYEGKIHLAVIVDDDPGRDLGLQKQPGHRFFYSLDEVEPMSLPDNRNEA
jgi:hypothetical protein